MQHGAKRYSATSRNARRIWSGVVKPSRLAVERGRAKELPASAKASAVVDAAPTMEVSARGRKRKPAGDGLPGLNVNGGRDGEKNAPFRPDGDALSDVRGKPSPRRSDAPLHAETIT